jgi:hypothetical protein
MTFRSRTFDDGIHVIALWRGAGAVNLVAR